MMTSRSIKTCIIIVLFSLSFTFPPAVPRVDGQSTSEIETSLQSRGARIKYSWQVRITIEALSAHRVPARGYAFLFNKGPALTAQFMLGGAPAVGANVSKEILLSTTRDLVGHPEKLSMAVANDLWDEGLREYRENYRLYRKWSEQGSLSAVEMQTMDKNRDDSGKILLGKELFSDIHSYKYDKSQWEDTSKALLSKVAALGEISDQFETAILAKELASIVAQARDGLREYPPWQKHLERTAELVAENQLRGPLDDKDPGAGGRRTNPDLAGPTGELSDPQFWMNRAEKIRDKAPFHPLAMSNHRHLINSYALCGNPETVAYQILQGITFDYRGKGCYVWLADALEANGADDQAAVIRRGLGPYDYKEPLAWATLLVDIKRARRLFQHALMARGNGLPAGDDMIYLGNYIRPLLISDNGDAFDLAMEISTAAFDVGQNQEHEGPLSTCFSNRIERNELAEAEQILELIRDRLDASYTTTFYGSYLAIAYYEAGETERAEAIVSRYLKDADQQVLRRVELAKAIHEGDVPHTVFLAEAQAVRDGKQVDESDKYKRLDAIYLKKDIHCALALWNSGNRRDAEIMVQSIRGRAHRMKLEWSLETSNTNWYPFATSDMLIHALVHMNWDPDEVRETLDTITANTDYALASGYEINRYDKYCQYYFYYCGYNALLEFQKKSVLRDNVPQQMIPSEYLIAASKREIQRSILRGEMARARTIVRDIWKLKTERKGFQAWLDMGGVFHFYTLNGGDVELLLELIDSLEPRKTVADHEERVAYFKLMANVEVAIGIADRYRKKNRGDARLSPALMEKLICQKQYHAEAWAHLSSIGLEDQREKKTAFTNRSLDRKTIRLNRDNLRAKDDQLRRDFQRVRGEMVITRDHNDEVDGISLQSFLQQRSITDTDIIKLATFPNLRVLFFSDTPIPDEALAHLAELDNLEMLFLKRTQITTASIAHLKRLDNLKYLYFSETEITDADIAELTKALPSCVVFK
jgi:hypothetical protein